MSDDAPQLFQHAVKVYEALEAESEDGVFKGKKVELFRRVGVSDGHYSQLFNTLEELGCIEQIQRGTAYSPTIIALHHPPDLETFRAAYKKVLTTPTPLDTMRQQIKQLEGRLPSVDIQSILANHETRLLDIEERLSGTS